MEFPRYAAHGLVANEGHERPSGYRTEVQAHRAADARQQAPRGQQKHILLRGGSRSGKTFVLVRALVLRGLRGAGSRHAILRFRGNAARASIWLDTFPKVMRLCFPGVAWKPHKQDGYVELPNGSEVWIGGLDDHERVEKILGMEFVTLFYNECSQIPYASVLMARTRLAQHIEGLQPREYFDCNPPGHRALHLPALEGGARPRDGSPRRPDPLCGTRHEPRRQPRQHCVRLPLNPREPARQAASALL